MAKPKSKPKLSGNNVCLREPELMARVRADFALREDADRPLASMVRKLIVEALAYRDRERPYALPGMTRDAQAAADATAIPVR